jgi:hypothetical protein
MRGIIEQINGNAILKISIKEREDTICSIGVSIVTEKALL